MLVVSLALGAVLIAGDGDSDAGSSQAAGPTDTPVTIVATPTNTPEPTPAAPPTEVPALPNELRDRLNALPQKLRDEAVSGYRRGALSTAQVEQIVTDYENRNPSLRVGSVLEVLDGRLRFEVFTTGEPAEVATFEQTLIQRGETSITLDQLMPGELVMVVSTDDGTTALTIDAFGVLAP